MEEAQLPTVVANPAFPTTAPSGYILTSGGAGTATFAVIPPPTSPTFGRVTQAGGPFGGVTLNTDKGIVTTGAITAGVGDVPALFVINNKVTTDSVILVSVNATTYMTGAISISVS